ncbi:MAG: hypothetical protein NDI61_06030 [Bdellovibrionaceae bacterium]|nr:hypothetical protein [Pseudobdellovibrionaceae bacterium]
MTKKILNTAAERAVPLLFDAESLGRSLREVAVDVNESEGNTTLSRWFHSTKDVDLLIWSDEDSNVIKHQVNFFGQVVEWNIFDGVKTGFILEEDVECDEASESEVSETIQFDVQPDAIAVRQALLLLAHVPDLADADKLRIRENLLNRQSGVPEMGHEYVKRFSRAQKLDRVERPGFWRRIRRWFSGTGS